MYCASVLIKNAGKTSLSIFVCAMVTKDDKRASKGSVNMLSAKLISPLLLLLQ